MSEDTPGKPEDVESWQGIQPPPPAGSTPPTTSDGPPVGGPQAPIPPTSPASSLPQMPTIPSTTPMPPGGGAIPGAATGMPSAPIGGPVGMQPLKLNDTLDVTMKLYKSGFGRIVGLSAVLVIPFEIIQLLIQQFLMDSLVNNASAFGVTSAGTIDPAVWRSFGIAMAMFALTAIVFTPLILASMTRMVGGIYLGEKPSIGTALSYGFRKILSVLWVAFLMGLAVYLPILLITLVGVLLATNGSDPGIMFVLVLVMGPLAMFIGIRLLFSVPIVVVEDVRGSKALKRSWFLVQGAWWKCFWAIIFVGIFVGLIGLAFSLIVVPISGGSASVIAIGTIVLRVLTSPISTILIVLLYFDGRIRKEALDLQVMAQEISRPTA